MTEKRDGMARRPALRVRRRAPADRPVFASHFDDGDWNALLEQGRAAEGLAESVDVICWSLYARGVPISYCAVDLSGLHRQIGGYACTWTRADGLSVERAGAATGSRLVKAASTLFKRLEHGKLMRADAASLPRDAAMSSGDGARITGVLVIPRSDQTTDRPLVILATQDMGGFSDEILARMQAGVPVLAAILELLALRRIARRILKVYLGRNARRQILKGNTAHGAGEAVAAVIWVSDLRGFTRASDLLPGPVLIELLNRALDGPMNAIHEQGGEVMEIVGDGIIAMFPFNAQDGIGGACARAIAAARMALQASDALIAQTAAEPDLPRLPLGIALHVGDVFLGNIGNRDRVDFTVIGPAVNAASRMEKLTKALERPLLLTTDFVAASATPERFESLGTHVLRGFAEPFEVFALADLPRPTGASRSRRRRPG